MRPAWQAWRGASPINASGWSGVTHCPCFVTLSLWVSALAQTSLSPTVPNLFTKRSHLLNVTADELGEGNGAWP